MAKRWALTQHVCGACYGRILARPCGDEIEFCCANCGREQVGEDETCICACGRLDAECRLNTDRSPEWPGEVVAVALAG
ncbi:hypothetical protein [Bradyrhizobium sp. STM 3561]|uniref:hypothetical protein n=1 Tax=Bradyrhizobium sp. STM 3561 TaxID=578923 RepID=UPI00388EEDF8